MIRLALTMLRRDWRSGELRILLLALIVSVASVSAVGFVADRVARALSRDAMQLLGGDLLLVADEPWPASVETAARERALRVANATTLVSMARAGERAQLSALKAVSPQYPLTGALRIADAANAPDHSVAAGPPAGTVWVEDRLLPLLGVRVGDAIELGDIDLRVSAVLTAEPDRGISFFNIAPRVLMSAADLARSGLIQAASRASFQIYLAGDSRSVEQFTQWLRPRLQRGQSIRTLDNARPEVRNTIDRSQRFLGLAALLSVFLGAVAVALAARRYAARHYDGFALMRCLGARSSTLLRLSILEFAFLGLGGTAAGCLIGFAAQGIIASWLGALAATVLPPPSMAPVLQALAMAAIVLLGFAFAPLLALRAAPALRALRRDTGGLGAPSALAYALGLVSFCGLVVWQARDLRLARYMLEGFVGGTAAIALAAALLLAALSRGPLARLATGGSHAWRHGLRNIGRHLPASTLQVSALAVGLAALLLLSFTRADLLRAWQRRVPPDAPNHFVLKMQPDQREAFARFFAANPPRDASGRPAPAAPALFPIVRGRLTAINDQPIDLSRVTEVTARRLVDREFNLSFTADLPASNEVSEGSWFGAEDLAHGALSVEEGIARTLGVKRGDRLTWSVAGSTFSAPVTNIRRLAWDSMRVNFFVITTPGLLQNLPASYITSFYLPPGNDEWVGRLVQAFPNLTVIDTGMIIGQVLHMVDQVVSAVQFLFVFALAAGLLVLYAALLASRDERLQESAVLRVLGASRLQVAWANRVEFVLLGALAGLLAALLASGTGWLIAGRVFEIPYTGNAWIWLAGPVLGVLCAAWNAHMAARLAVSSPPIVALREAV